jgi:hypothetical protein
VQIKEFIQKLILVSKTLFYTTKVDCWEKRNQGLFQTFEDFEFRAAFTDRKNGRSAKVGVFLV